MLPGARSPSRLPPTTTQLASISGSRPKRLLRRCGVRDRRVYFDDPDRVEQAQVCERHQCRGGKQIGALGRRGAALARQERTFPSPASCHKPPKGDQIIRKDVDVDSDEGGGPGEDRSLRETVLRCAGSGAQD